MENKAQILSIATKSCKKCGDTKPLSDYKKNKNCKAGIINYCSNCYNASQRKWNANNPDKLKEARERWKNKDPDRYKEFSKRRNGALKKKRQENFIQRITENGRLCSTCKNRLPIDNFTKSKNISDGYSGDCKSCKNAKSKNWRSKNPLKRSEYQKKHSRRSYLRNAYGLSIDEYNLLLEIQCNRCAICQNNFSEVSKYPHVDHCHKTGKVRGILCHGCNNGIGHFKDNIKSLFSAIKYLKRTNQDI